jgi:hypothetical protein
VSSYRIKRRKRERSRAAEGGNFRTFHYGPIVLRDDKSVERDADDIPTLEFIECPKCSRQVAILGAIGDPLALLAESPTGEEMKVPLRLPVVICLACRNLFVGEPKLGIEAQDVAWNLPKLGRDAFAKALGVDAQPCEECFPDPDDEDEIGPLAHVVPISNGSGLVN